MNEDLQVEQLDNYLAGKNIALCVTGGIAAIETPKIARHLRRYGAEVHAYATHTAFQFVGKAALEWGTGKPVVSKLSGLAEHICLEDLVLIAPATYNVINSIVGGIADSAVTTLVASALGKKVPILIAPTMHESMYQNPILQENLKRAEQYGITIIPPRIGEGKAKIPSTPTLVDAVFKALEVGNYALEVGEHAP